MEMIMERECNVCHIVKPYSEFHKNKKRKGGIQHVCKICKREQDKNTKLKRKLIGKCFYCSNIPENGRKICFRCRETNRKIAKSHNYKETRKKRYRDRIKNDTQYHISHNLRSRLRGAIQSDQKAGSAVQDLGCSIEEFKIYIENQFVEGQSWENWGCKVGDWSLDHIKPLHLFNLSDRCELLKACHYTNLRPLWHIENISRTYEEYK
jgi:hypothetical protein